MKTRIRKHAIWVDYWVAEYKFLWWWRRIDSFLGDNAKEKATACCKAFANPVVIEVTK